MKNILKLPYILFLTVSCNLLEEEPENFFSEDNFYRTQLDAESAINAAYRPLAASPSPDNGVYNDCLWYLADLASDNTTTGPTEADLERSQIDNFTFDATNAVFMRTWSASYDGINKANIVLEKVPPISFDRPERKETVLGEAYFLRALYYFNLARLFGDVPLLTEPFTALDQEQQPSRSATEQVYEQIIADLRMAEEQLPPQWSGDDIGRATKGATTALMAKVFLTQENWSDAVTKAQEVMSSGQYALFDTYEEVFLSSQSLEPAHNENGIESIFEVQMRSNQELRNRLVSSLAPQGSFIINSGRSPGDGIYVPTESFYAAYANEDARKAWNFINRYEGPNGDTVEVQPHFYKYRDPGMGSASSSNNYYVLRYADVLLMFAEATNEVSGPTIAAYDAINQVRTRAGLSTLAPGLSSDAFRDAVLQERALEFPWEGHRWFDLVRTNRLASAMQEQGKNVQSYHQLYPIPQRERDLNPSLTQNSGY